MRRGPRPAATTAAPRLWPAFLRLEGRRVLVVGGGRVAAGRVAGLRDAGARVTVVAPDVRPEVHGAGVRVLRRAFRGRDLDGMWLAVSAATPEVNRRVASAAALRCVFVNAVDHPEAATVFAGAVVRRGDATVAISTAGRAPALAGLLRQALESVMPHDLARWTLLAAELRRKQRSAGVPAAERRGLLLRALQRLPVGSASEEPLP